MGWLFAIVHILIMLFQLSALCLQIRYTLKARRAWLDTEKEMERILTLYDTALREMSVESDCPNS